MLFGPALLCDRAVHKFGALEGQKQTVKPLEAHLAAFYV